MTRNFNYWSLDRHLTRSKHFIYCHAIIFPRIWICAQQGAPSDKNISLNSEGKESSELFVFKQSQTEAFNSSESCSRAEYVATQTGKTYKVI